MKCLDIGCVQYHSDDRIRNQRRDNVIRYERPSMGTHGSSQDHRTRCSPRPCFSFSYTRVDRSWYDHVVYSCRTEQLDRYLCNMSANILATSLCQTDTKPYRKELPDERSCHRASAAYGNRLLCIFLFLDFAFHIMLSLLPFKAVIESEPAPVKARQWRGIHSSSNREDG